MYCECGCGERTRLKRGKPQRFVFGHVRRKHTRWVEEDRGFETPCHIWQLYIGKNGYGYDHDADFRTVLAHRHAFEQRHGPIPSDLVIDHLCRVRECVNPDHMEAVPQKVNVARGDLAEAARRDSKLTAWDRFEIHLHRKRENPPTLAALAEQYGVSESRIGQIAAEPIPSVHG